jgi:hypothetical protein
MPVHEKFHKFNSFPNDGKLSDCYIFPTVRDIHRFMSFPLHSYFLRPKVQNIVKLILDFKVIRICGVTLDFLKLNSLYCIYQILFNHPREPLFWSIIMLYYCIHSYYKLRCKYEKIRDLHIKCENKSNSTLAEHKSTDVQKPCSSDE